MTATAIKSWSSTAGSNNSASPNGAPEGMAPSGVNDTIRQNMASIRDWYVDPAWIDMGYTYTYVSGTSFKISGLDKTADFVVGRRIRAVGTSTGTIYGVIATSAFSTDTTVTVTWDSGSLSNETLAVSIGLPALGKPIPYAALGLTGSVVMADLANLAQALIIGRASGAGTGVPKGLSASEVYTILGVSAFAQTILDDAAASNALTTLGISSFIQTVLDDADAATARATLGVVNFTVSSSKIVLGAVTIQFGEYTSGASGPTITFGTAFSGTPYCVQCTNESSSPAAFKLTSVGASSFVCTQFQTATNAGLTTNFYWLAIGPT